MYEDYRKVIVETYRNAGEPSGASLRARPLPGQGLSINLNVECSSKMRNAHPIGTKFLIHAKLTDRKGGTQFLYSSFRWKYEVLSDEVARTLLENQTNSNSATRAQP